MITIADYLGYERAFKNFGINYTVEPGHLNRGHGDLKDVRFIVIHHTAGGGDAGDIRIVRDGRSDLPGPLSQLVLKRNGEPHIIAVGVCWHAPGSINYRGVAPGQGNWYSIGIEGVSNGYNDWTPEQRANYPRVVAALLKDMNLPSDAFIFHRDYQPREKIDPGGMERNWFQAEVNRHYNAGGQPPAPQKTAIQLCRDANPWLGDKTSEGEELVLPIGDHGRATFYRNGAIYHSTPTGSQALSLEMLEKYASLGYEGSFLGFPINTVHEIAGGRAQGFQGASIYFSESTGAHTIGGAIGTKWASLNWEKGYGFPETDEISLPDGKGKLQKFQKGHIYFHPETGAYTIRDLIWDRFSKENYENILGYPTTDAINLPNKDGQFQIFTNGHIYSIKGKAYAVYLDFMFYYERLGYESGRLGCVVSNKEKVEGTSDTWVQYFEGGSIEIDRIAKKAKIFINGESISV